MLSILEQEVATKMVDRFFDEKTTEETRRAWFMPPSNFVQQLDCLEAKRARLREAINITAQFQQTRHLGSF
jgi:hypothetical protein